MLEIEKFLLDNNLNDENFYTVYELLKLHKEVYDDRFIIIYFQKCRDGLLHNAYEVGGYFDIKDKCLYETGYLLCLLLEESKLIKQSSFSNLYNNLTKDIDNYINNYALINKEVLKPLGRENYYKNDLPYINSNERKVRESFIKGDDNIKNYYHSCSHSLIEYSDEYETKDLFIDYLNNPDKIINKYAEMIINKNKDSLGESLLVYEYEINYYKKLIKNKNNEFRDVYLNKKIYDSIKDIDAKTINITIKYGNSDLTFNYDYNILKRDLLNDCRGSNAWGVAYDKVSNFIKEKTNSLDSRKTEEFLFSHISSITYGRKSLYKNDNIKENQSKEKGDK